MICINSFLSHEEYFQKLILTLGKPDPEPNLFLGRRTSLAPPTLRLARKILMKSILFYRQHSRTRSSRRPTATSPSSSTSASPCCPGVRRVATRYSYCLWYSVIDAFIIIIMSYYYFPIYMLFFICLDWEYILRSTTSTLHCTRVPSVCPVVLVHIRTENMCEVARLCWGDSAYSLY